MANQCLIELEVLSLRGSVCPPRARDWVAQRPRVEPNTAGLKKEKQTERQRKKINGMIPNGILQIFIDDLSNHRQRSSLQHQMGVNAEIHSQTLCGESLN